MVVWATSQVKSITNGQKKKKKRSISSNGPTVALCMNDDRSIDNNRKKEEARDCLCLTSWSDRGAQRRAKAIKRVRRDNTYVLCVSVHHTIIAIGHRSIHVAKIKRKKERKKRKEKYLSSVSVSATAAAADESKD